MSRKFSRLYILDGYNILRCGSIYTDRVGESPDFTDWQYNVFNSARDALISDVSMLLDEVSCAIIVYDGSTNMYNSCDLEKKVKQDNNRIEVIYSNYSTSADSTIEKFCVQNKEKYKEIIVVTNDISIQNTVLRHNITTMSANIFCDKVKYLYEFDDSNTPGTSKYKTTKIKDVIKKDTATKLDILKNNLLSE